MGSRVFVGSCGGGFFALESTSGEVAWKYDTTTEGLRATFHSDPVVVGDLVITASDGSPDSHLYAFEVASGRLRWKQPAPPSGVSVGLAADQDTVYVVTNGGKVLALGVADGVLRWSVDLPAGARDRRGRLTLAAGRLIVVEAEGPVLAFEATSGQELWHQDLGEPLNPAAMALGDSLLVVTTEGELLRLAAKTGSVESRSPLAAGTAFGGLVAAGPCLIVSMAPRSVVCADVVTGRPRWTFTASADLSTFQPLLHGDVVWIGNESGRLTAVALADGTESRFLKVPGIPRGLAVAGSRLVVGTLEGAVLGFEDQ